MIRRPTLFVAALLAAATTALTFPPSTASGAGAAETTPHQTQATPVAGGDQSCTGC